MKQNKDEFKCIYEIGVVYGYLAASIWSFFMSILMVLIMLIEKIYSIYIVIFCIFFVFFGIVSLAISLFNRDKKFVINLNECKVQSRKSTLFLTKTQSIRRIVILVMPRGGKQFIIFDCEEYPFLIAQDFLYHKSFCIRYTSRRLNNIRKYCSNCKIDMQELSSWVKW